MSKKISALSIMAVSCLLLAPLSGLAFSGMSPTAQPVIDLPTVMMNLEQIKALKSSGVAISPCVETYEGFMQAVTQLKAFIRSEEVKQFSMTNSASLLRLDSANFQVAVQDLEENQADVLVAECSVLAAGPFGCEAQSPHTKISSLEPIYLATGLAPEQRLEALQIALNRRVSQNHAGLLIRDFYARNTFQDSLRLSPNLKAQQGQVMAKIALTGELSIKITSKNSRMAVLTSEALGNACASGDDFKSALESLRAFRGQ